MEKNLKFIEKNKDFNIKIDTIAVNPLYCKKIISVSGKLGTAEYVFHNQPINVNSNDIYGYNSKFVKNKIEKLIEGVTNG